MTCVTMSLFAVKNLFLFVACNKIAITILEILETYLSIERKKFLQNGQPYSTARGSKQHFVKQHVPDTGCYSDP